ncbi:MAG: RibD family protein [Oligoflexia bacterium]|nr:RibD family protein [Oligoflexia bacterium]
MAHSQSRPFVFIHTTASLDGSIDHSGPERLVLSNATHLAEVDRLRADSDAILIGAGTLRRDNPRLLVYSEKLRELRRSKGQSEFPIKVTCTCSGEIPAGSSFFSAGNGEKIVYCPAPRLEALTRQLGTSAQTVGMGNNVVAPHFILQDLYRRGVRRLMIEGGSSINALFLSSGLVDELWLAIAPLVIGAETAPRLFNPQKLSLPTNLSFQLLSAAALDGLVLARYAVRYV